MKKFISGGTTVICRPIPASRYGVIEQMVYGHMSASVYADLRPQLLEYLKNFPAVVSRLDTALDAMTEPPPVTKRTYARTGSPPQILVLRDSANLAMWVEHSVNLARHGVIRAVFLRSELPEAYEFAEQAAKAHLFRRASQRDSVESDFGSL